MYPSPSFFVSYPKSFIGAFPPTAKSFTTTVMTFPSEVLTRMPSGFSVRDGDQDGLGDFPGIEGGGSRLPELESLVHGPDEQGGVGFVVAAVGIDSLDVAFLGHSVNGPARVAVAVHFQAVALHYEGVALKADRPGPAEGHLPAHGVGVSEGCASVREGLGEVGHDVLSCGAEGREDEEECCQSFNHFMKALRISSSSSMLEIWTWRGFDPSCGPTIPAASS